MEGFSIKSVILGFIAGAIASVTVHELISWWLVGAGYYSATPWSMEPSALTGLPQLANDAGWGGLWGIVFAAILGGVPKGSMTIRGALLGLIGPGLIGALVLVPLIVGAEPFLGGDPAVIWPGLWPQLVTAAGFGIATAWLYGFLTSGCRLP